MFNMKINKIIFFFLLPLILHCNKAIDIKKNENNIIQQINKKKLINNKKNNNKITKISYIDNINKDKLTNEQKIIVNEIVNDIKKIDINNNVVNNKQLRLQRCYELINKINDYQEKAKEKIFNNVLLTYKKIIIRKQTHINYLYQSFTKQLLMMMINLFFIYKIIINAYYLSCAAKENRTYAKISKPFLSDSAKNNIVLEEKKKDQKLNIKQLLTFLKNNKIEVENDIDEIKEIINIGQKDDQEEEKKNEIIDLHQFMVTSILRLIANPLKGYCNNTIYYFQFFYHCCFYCLLHYLFDFLFNNYNARLLNTIIIFLYRHRQKKIANYYFVDVKNINYFFSYYHDFYLFDNDETYGYIPSLFDGTSNWFLSFNEIIYFVLFVMTAIPYCYYFAESYFLIKSYTKTITFVNNDQLFFTSQVMYEQISSIIKKNHQQKITLTNLKAMSINYFFYLLCFLIKDQYLTNEKITDEEKIVKNILINQYFLLKKYLWVLIIAIHYLILFLQYYCCCFSCLFFSVRYRLFDSIYAVMFFFGIALSWLLIFIFTNIEWHYRKDLKEYFKEVEKEDYHFKLTLKEMSETFNYLGFENNNNKFAHYYAAVKNYQKFN